MTYVFVPGALSAGNEAAAALAERRWQDAANAAAAVLDSAPDDRDALRIRGFALARLDRPAESLQAFDQVLASDPDDPEALMGKARTFRFMKDFGRALPILDRAIETAPGIARYHVERGNTRFLLQRYDEARADFERAADLDPALPGMNAYLGEIHLFTREPAKALAAAQAGGKREPTFGIHRVNQAHASMFLGNFEAAKALYLKSAHELDMDGATPGKDIVAADFKRMRSAGLEHPDMDRVLALFTSGRESDAKP